MKMIKCFVLMAALSAPAAYSSVNEEKVLQAIELLQAVETGIFEHQCECEFKDTEYCTCDGNYLALIEYNRILQTIQLLNDSIEEDLGGIDEES